MNCRGASNASRRLVLPLDVARAGISMDSRVIPRSAWLDVASYTTGLYFSSHHVGVILMVGGSVTSTRSCEKVKIYPLGACGIGERHGQAFYAPD